MNYDETSCMLCGKRLIGGKCPDSFDPLRELAEWRSGKRRVLWRMCWTHEEGCSDYYFQSRAMAQEALKRRRRQGHSMKLYRITVRPKR